MRNFYLQTDQILFCTRYQYSKKAI